MEAGMERFKKGCHLRGGDGVFDFVRLIIYALQTVYCMLQINILQT